MRYTQQTPSKFFLAVLCSSLTIGSAIGLAIGSSAQLRALSETSIRADEARSMPASSVIQAIRQTVRQQFGVQRIIVMSSSEQNWPDGCLGLPRGKEACTMAIVPGWRIQVSDRIQTWTYRTDRTGTVLRLENPDRTGLPQAVAKKLIQQVARETNTVPSRLRITEIKAQEFNGCMGVYERATQPCTANLIRGWQAIVTSPSQTFVYHLSQNADQIVQNVTASGAKRSIRVSVDLFGEPEPIDATVVFQSSSSGDLTGRMSRTVLTQDGKIIRYQSSPTAKFAPVLIKTLSPEQLNAFKKGLENQRFPNLNGLSYLTSAALADYPTTTYQSPNVTTQFIDLEKKNLPRSLQQVIVNWETLIQS